MKTARWKAIRENLIKCQDANQITPICNAKPPTINPQIDINLPLKKYKI